MEFFNSLERMNSLLVKNTQQLRRWKRTLIKAKTQLLLLGFVLFFFNTAFSQTNLVPNFSFEEFTDCPFNISLYQKLNIKPNLWFKPDNRYASYINACSNDSIYGGGS